MAQPIVKYTLTKRGTVPGWLSSDSRAFAGEHGITGNKSGKIPRYEEPQDTIFLGVASGDPDSDGTPDDYVGTFANKAALQTYLTETGSTLQYKTTTATATGIQTATIVGLATVWATSDTDYQGGLSTSTTSKYTASGVGTVATISASQVTKVVVKSDTTTGDSSATTNTPIVIDAASTLSGVSTNVGIVTTTGTDNAGVTTITTTTDTTSFTYTDVQTTSSTSKSETTTDGVTTRTDTVVTTETTNYETSYDYAAEATRLWDIYTAINS